MQITILASFVGAALAAAPMSAASANPATDAGRLWQRVFDPALPAAPPRLVPVKRGTTRLSAQGALCMHGGEQVVLHLPGNFGDRSLSLSALAMQDARCGVRTRVRVAVTGAVIEVKVVGHDSGLLDSGIGLWR